MFELQKGMGGSAVTNMPAKINFNITSASLFVPPVTGKALTSVHARSVVRRATLRLDSNRCDWVVFEASNRDDCD